ncbi:YceI family protein [Actinacidiphila oryziradicis]|uniref:YceI family protein n=1 Tax=Actinacidiphila oryziradicis TaxID=2571141 RepID=UPI001FE666E9|nr:YceI family protein [Actinacidiphila oryziradicis]
MIDHDGSSAHGGYELMAMPGEKFLPAAGTYEIDPAASTVSFVTRAMFGLLPVRGTFTIEHGRITVAELAEELSSGSRGRGSQLQDRQSAA